MGARHGPPQSTCSRLDAFDMWALRKILRIPYTRHVSNVEVRGTTGCSPLSHLVTNRRLWLFGHIARSSSREDHHRALAVAIRQVLLDWKRPIGRTSHSWLHAIEADLGPLNFGLASFVFSVRHQCSLRSLSHDNTVRL